MGTSGKPHTWVGENWLAPGGGGGFEPLSRTPPPPPFWAPVMGTPDGLTGEVGGPEVPQQKLLKMIPTMR